MRCKIGLTPKRNTVVETPNGMYYGYVKAMPSNYFNTCISS
jgi:hypothetical protein